MQVPPRLFARLPLGVNQEPSGQRPHHLSRADRLQHPLRTLDYGARIAQARPSGKKIRHEADRQR